MPENTYNRRLNMVNILMCICNVLSPALVWVFYGQEELRAGNIQYDIEQAFLAMSCFVLCFGLFRIVKFVGSLKNMMINKITIIMHIVSYLFLIVVNLVESIFY